MVAKGLPYLFTLRGSNNVGPLLLIQLNRVIPVIPYTRRSITPILLVFLWVESSFIQTGFCEESLPIFTIITSSSLVLSNRHIIIICNSFLSPHPSYVNLLARRKFHSVSFFPNSRGNASTMQMLTIAKCLTCVL